jgi:type II secretory pathway pseudopilin PulG
VIAIIGILTTIAVVALNNARAKARDAKRVADIKQIQTALDMFFIDKSRYPTAAEWNSGSLYSTSSVGTTTYMTAIPAASNPPDGGCDSSTNAFGYTASDDGTSYTLSFCLGGPTGSLVAGPACLSAIGLSNINCAPNNFSPVDLSGLQFWLKADVGITLNGSNVSSWADQSGNGHDAVQATDTYQPLLVDSQLNGEPIIRFDGNNDSLQNNTLVVAQPYTLFYVVKDYVDTNNYNWFINNYPTMALANYNPSLGYYTIYAGSWMTSSIPYPFGYSTISAIYSGADAKSNVWYNGSLATTGGNTGNGGINATTGNYLYIGTLAYNFSGESSTFDVAEIIIYNSALSDTDRQSVENYLADKYGL